MHRLCKSKGNGQGQLNHSLKRHLQVAVRCPVARKGMWIGSIVGWRWLRCTCEVAKRIKKALFASAPCFSAALRNRM